MSKLEVDKITPQSGTTLTIGDSGDTIVIDSTSVSGAKLAAPTLVGSASSAGSILFKEDTDNGTNAVTLKGPAATADVTLTLPAATDTVVGRQTTDTLTNKTINASQLVDASIATGKLADDAVTYAKMQDTSTANRVLGAASAGTISEVQIATDMIVDANVTTAKINDNAITLAKMASGTDGNIISYDASGNPVAIATGSDGQVLTSAGAGAQPAFETPASAANTPAFLAYVNSNTQSIANNTTVQITNYNTEIFDTDNGFANGVFTVPSGKGGRYFLNGSISTSVAAVVLDKQFNIQIKAGSTTLASFTILRPPYAQFVISTIAELSENTTISMNMYQDSGSALTIDGARRTFFGGFRLIS